MKKIIEKPSFFPSKKILDNLLIGTFWFKDPKIALDLPNKDINGEAFIAKSIGNQLKKLKVISFPVDYWLSLGTPKEINLAKYWFDYFENSL